MRFVIFVPSNSHPRQLVILSGLFVATLWSFTRMNNFPVILAGGERRFTYQGRRNSFSLDKIRVAGVISQFISEDPDGMDLYSQDRCRPGSRA